MVAGASVQYVSALEYHEATPLTHSSSEEEYFTPSLSAPENAIEEFFCEHKALCLGQSCPESKQSQRVCKGYVTLWWSMEQ